MRPLPPNRGPCALLALALAATAACSRAAPETRREPEPTRAQSAPAAIAAESKPAPIRALWITRWDYHSEADVRAAVDRAAEAGFDTLFFQVRGNATAFYRSSFEPWAEELGGADPGFDPLEVAIAQAHARRVALHAWVNVLPAWWGSAPPRDPRQVCNAHPEWLWYDQSGRRQPLLERFYVSLNPCLPEVRYYILSVFADLLARYALDGLHMDYVRYPCEPPVIPAQSGLDYPRDARTVALFEAESGKTPDGDRAAWGAWRAEQLSKLVRAVRAMQRELRPAAWLSAAVGSDPEHHLELYFQDARRWCREGLLDLAVPMNYTKDEQQFAARVEKWSGMPGLPRLVIGVMLHDMPLEQNRARLALALERANGFSLFAYSTLFDSANSDPAQQGEAARAKREALRAAWLPAMQPLPSAAPR